MISLIPNILTAPLLGIITVLGALMAILGQLSLKLSVLLGYANNIFLSIVLYITKWSASLPFASVRMVTPPLAAVVVYYLVVFIPALVCPDEGHPS